MRAPRVVEVVRRSRRHGHARRMAEAGGNESLAAAAYRPIAARLSNATLRRQVENVTAVLVVLRLFMTLSEYLSHMRRLLRVTSACDGSLQILFVNFHGSEAILVRKLLLFRHCLLPR